MYRRLKIITLAALIASLAAGCSVRRFVPEGEHIIRNNTINIQPQDVEFTKSDVETYISQKSSHALGLNTQLWVYYKTKGKVNKKFWRWINESFGKEPVYYNESQARNSSKQIRMYLENRGYFNTEVAHSVSIDDYKAYVTYDIHAKEPYRVRRFDIQISDTTIARYVSEISNKFEVKEGDNFNVRKLDDIRTQINTHLRNNGYYNFTKDYVVYSIDSSLNEHKMDICLKIEPFWNQAKNSYEPHQQFFINQVNLYPNYSTLNSRLEPTDAMAVAIGRNKERDTVNFIYYGDPRIRFRTFNQAIFVKSGQPFSQANISQTYKALGNFKIYSSARISFDTIADNKLNCNIYLTRSKANFYKFQLEGTDSGGDFGIKSVFSFNNNNLFKGAEVFRLSTRYGIEAQHITDDYIENNEGIFNTQEFSVNASLNIPRFLTLFWISDFIYDYQPKTVIDIGYNLQVRTLYTRYITNASFGYYWKTSDRVQHIFTPISLNSVKVNPSDYFRNALNQEQNQRIKDQYTDHLLLGLNYSFTFSNQDISNPHDFIYFRGNFESSGNLISLFNNTSLITTSDEHHELFGIRYAQFVRFDIDTRFYHIINPDNQIVLRLMTGIGVPYGNSYDMPFEKSFYAGGANGMRGWRYRGLGPGSFTNESNIERIGDMQLEMNAEYRFPIYNIVKGAIFVDAGNIWTYHPNTQLGNGNFTLDNFYNQIAVDAGLGIRFDFSFFVFRIDLAAPIRNPETEQWLFNSLSFRKTIWNFGIGYPF